MHLRRDQQEWHCRSRLQDAGGGAEGSADVERLDLRRPHPGGGRVAEEDARAHGSCLRDAATAEPGWEGSGSAVAG